jgi:release factor glutamine methyltransferase
MSDSSNNRPQAGRRPQRALLRAVLSELRTSLRPVAGECAAGQAETLLCHVLGVSREQLFLSTSSLSDTQRARVTHLARRLRAGEPLAYVLGIAYFHCVKLTVSPAVLIPRPDTETLVETVLRHEPPDTRTFVDMGAGSGAITAALCAQRRAWRGVAVDISREAAVIASGNLRGAACLCAVADRLEAVRGPADFIVSNPPYVPTATIDTLDTSVRSFEPRAALDGGADGLDFYRYLVTQAPPRLKPGAAIYLEIGYDQSATVQELFAAAGWRAIELFRDLASRPRVVRARRPT